MTLEAAARQALSAAEAGDLDALARALDARAEAIAGGGVPTLEILALGQRTLDLLQALIRTGGQESARLEQIHAAFAGNLNRPPNIDYLG